MRRSLASGHRATRFGLGAVVVLALCLRAGTGSAQICRTEALPSVILKAEPSYNVTTARVPAFAEVRDVTVAGAKVGALYFDAANGIAAFVVSKAPAGATVAAEEAAGRTAFDGVGPVSTPIVQSITTWDNLPAILARYDWAGSDDLKTKVNAAVAKLLGNPAALSGLFPDAAGLAGPHTLRVEFVRRSDQQAVVMGTAARVVGFGPAQEIRLQDVANGTALADASDGTGVECDRFTGAGPVKVDFLWVVDNSGSMGDDQDALVAAANEMASQLTNAGIDWRMAVAYTDLHMAPSANDTCLGAAGPGRRRVCPFTRDVDVFKNGTANCAYVKCGTCGSSSERGFHSARIAVERFLAGSGCEPGGECFLRPDAQLVIIFFTDTGEQTPDTNPPPGQPDNSVASWVRYFSDYDLSRPGAQRALVHGILCPGRQAVGAEGPCTDALLDPALYDRYSQLVSQMGGVEGSIRDTDQPQLPGTIRVILNAAIAAASPYRLTKPAISATLKVVVDRLEGPVEVPRDPLDGFDFDAAAGRVVILGSYFPAATGREVAVSYRHWTDAPSPTVTLSVTLTGSGSGTVTSNPAGIVCGADCTEGFASGTMVTLTATPAAGSVFAGWSGGGCSGTGACAVTMTANTTVTAAFELRTFTLTVVRVGTGNGTVTSNPAGINCGADCSEAYTSGMVVTLTATPAAGSVFAGWSGGGCSGTGACTVTMDASKAVTATFNPAGTLGLTLATNATAFRAGDSVVLSVGVDNPGLAATVDFYFGAVLPDGDTVVFFTDLAFNSGVGSLASPTTLRPIVAGVDLAAPFVFSNPSFFTYPWVGMEPAGSYVLFLAAVAPGALADNRVDPGDIVALAMATVTFTP